MSRARKESERRPLDAYMTPAWAIDAMLPHLPLGGRILEPACGEGEIMRRLVASGVKGPAISGIEIDQERADKARDCFDVEQADALDPLCWWGSPDLIITNPPFRHAIEFATKALAQVRPGGTVALLLRVGFLETHKRRPFHLAHPADLYIFPRRPSFFGSGSDGAVYAWFTWGPGRGGRYFVLDVPTAAEVRAQSSQRPEGAAP